MGHFAEALSTACQHAPATTEIDELTQDIARWGTREMRRSTKARTGERFDAERWVQRAHNQRAWMEHRKALKTVARTLEWQPNHHAALRLRQLLLVETDAKLSRLWSAADDWAAQYPSDHEAQLARAVAGLANNRPESVTEAESMLRKNPDQFVLTMALGGFYFRRKNYSQTRQVWEEFAIIAADKQQAQVARDNIDYLRRYEDSRLFRWRERMKQAGSLILGFSPVLIYVGVLGYQAYQAWQPEDPAMPSEVVERMEEHKEEMARIERELQESTGLIIASGETLRQRAASGEAAAQYTLATHLLLGDDPEETKQGIENLEKSAAQDYRWALWDLAKYMAKGEIVEKDETRAVALFEQAAALGSPRAARMAGEHYFQGRGVAMDKAKAFQFFQQSAKGGNTAGKAWTGFMLERGEGVAADFEAAVNYYQQAAEDEYSWAMQRLIMLYFTNRDGSFDHEEMEAWLWSVAEEGSPKFKLYAVVWLSLQAKRPEGEVSRILAWLDGLIEQGNPEAMFIRGDLDWKGILVPYLDRMEAIKWYKMAADQDYPAALYHMARCYAFGVGVERDSDKARHWRDLFVAAKEVRGLSLQALDDALEAAARHFSVKVPPDQVSSSVWRTPPKYPYALRVAGITGSAQVRFTINVDGFAEDVRVVKATELAFGIAALDAVLFWRFEPRAESETMEVPIIFNLRDSDQEASEQSDPFEG